MQVDVDGDGEIDCDEFVNLMVESMPSLVPDEEEEEPMLDDAEIAFREQQGLLASTGLAAAASGH